LEDNKTYLHPDSVVTTAYEYGGKRAQFIVNYNLHSVDIRFDKQYAIYVDSKLQTVVETNKLTLSPLSVVMIDLKE
jgi:hypothetical protein